MPGACAAVDPLLSAGAWLRFPPGNRNVFVPASGRREAAAGVCLYTASRWTGELGQAAAFAAVRALGPRVLPLRREPWEPPLPGEAWAMMRRRWARLLGEPDALAVYERPQASRRGVGVLLLRGGRQTGFVKLRPSGGQLELERQVLLGLGRHGLPGLHLPEVLGWGTEGGWDWLALAPLPPQPHRPERRTDAAALADVVGAHLARALPRPAGTPAHYRAMHGDLTPWNVRRLRDRRVLVLDWEDARWGPPGADSAYYRATRCAVAHRRDAGPASPEVVDFWLAELARRPPDDRDAALTSRLEDVFARMQLPYGHP